MKTNQTKGEKVKTEIIQLPYEVYAVLPEYQLPGKTHFASRWYAGQPTGFSDHQTKYLGMFWAPTEKQAIQQATSHENI